MPQRGGLRLAVAALTCAVGLGTAASASANELTLWACHAPDGTPLGAAPFGGATTFGGGCDAAGTGFDAGGVSAASGTNGFNLRVPPGLVLKQALITRRTTGLGSEGGTGRYSATFKWYTGPDTARVPHSAELDSATTDVSGDVTADAPDSGLASDGSVQFAITGTGASADFQRVGLKVDDPSDPTASVGGIGNSISAPAIDPTKPSGEDNDGFTHVAVWANDNGAGLWKADLYVDGAKAGTVEYVNDGDAGLDCVTALDAGMALPLDNDCQHNSRKSIKLDSTQWADGPHTLAVKLYDASGRVSDVLKDYATTFVNHPDHGNPSANLQIGSGNTTQQNGSGSTNNNGSGGVAGESTTSCNSPRLSMELSQKPLKVSKGVPVLVSGKRYRFRGKLTCLVGTHRKSAPAKTAVELFNTIGKRTYRKGGATVRNAGAITMILSYKSSRTLVFRYTNPDGRRSQVKLKIKVVKKSR
jgi:hypothetical protein